jgi:hypothetical protein
MLRGMASYFEPGEPVEPKVGEGERLWQCQVSWPERDGPVEMAVAAVDEAQAREKVIEMCRTMFAGVTHPPQVAVFSPEDYLRR